MSDTPRTDAAERAAMDDAGSITRMEPIWETMVKLERELNEANSDRLRLRERLGCGCGGDYGPCKDCNEALSTPPPPVVAKADADALANACKLCAAVIGPPDNIDWASIEDCDAAYAAAQTAMQAYHAKYPAP
jgi:hypothetical protein